MDKVFNKLRNLDAYPKINEDFYNRTLSGGVITLVSSIVMLLLFFSEFSMFRSSPSSIYPLRYFWLRSLYRSMVADWSIMRHTVVHALEQKCQMMIVVIRVKKFVKHT
ncbi:endoplasmic reticulum-Golgi intermediate compartment protein 3-like isoform X3 [Ipomoea triloba]|uniref:endoplasmic reticulum-Golgi intermediate compartment protein 3-like isoform X3 n=1 Tax=Ipomoea triloba TaxID=35885 RepID=UPI00125D1A90|nr:endoplasmic reticulum-Golgi intermediate compartment protein 3-like isoform X3 [Ipomoea triloba]